MGATWISRSEFYSEYAMQMKQRLMNMGIKVLMQTSKTLKSKNDIIKPLKKGTMHSTKKYVESNI